eukprot:m.332717 g.332717  ORF g.332717 m.332717 type:complete len:296 (+) comp55641_c0_seq3:494-1381(+)
MPISRRPWQPRAGSLVSDMLGIVFAVFAPRRCGVTPAALFPHLQCGSEQAAASQQDSHTHRNDYGEVRGHRLFGDGTVSAQPNPLNVLNPESSAWIDCCCCGTSVADDRDQLASLTNTTGTIPHPTVLAESWKASYVHRTRLQQQAATSLELQANYAVIVSQTRRGPGIYQSLSEALGFLRVNQHIGRVIIHPGLYHEQAGLLVDFPCEIFGVSAREQFSTMLLQHNRTTDALASPSQQRQHSLSSAQPSSIGSSLSLSCRQSHRVPTTFRWRIRCFHVDFLQTHVIRSRFSAMR